MVAVLPDRCGVFALSLVLGLAPACTGQAPSPKWVAQDDTRLVVTVSPMQRAVVKQVMRENLERVQSVLAAAGAGDRETVHRLSKEAVITPGPGGTEPTLRPLLPDEWRAMGKELKGDWKALAELTRAGGSPNEITAGVARVTAHCVTCHKQYRLETH